jgi:hypothetical protein
MDIIDLLTSILLSTSTMDSWRIEEYYLYSFLLIGIYPWDTSLCRLGTMRDRRDFLADESIEESRFSGIGSTDDGDISGFRHYD